jgi:hypothetical protein
MTLTCDHLPPLRGAHDLLANYEYDYICPALSDAANRLDLDQETVTPIHEVITQGIDHYSVLDSWLYDQGFRPQGEADYMRLARLAWLDKLIWDIKHAE